MKRMRIAATLVLATILQTLPLKAQEQSSSSGTIYTIENCYRMVHQNYPLVKRYGLIELTKEFTLKNAYMHYFPQIALTGSATYQTDALTFPFEIPGYEFPTYSKDHYAAIVELSQVLWDGGMIAAQRENIRAKAQIDREQQETDMYALRTKINDLYFGILMLDEQIRQLDIALKEMDVQKKRIEGCIANGVANPSDLDLLEVERISREQNRNNASSLIETYLRMLSLLTGERIDDSAMLIRPISDKTDKEDMLYSLLYGEIRRPELRIFDARIKEATTQLDYWTAGGLPQFRLYVKGGYGRPGLDMMDDDLTFFAVGGVQMVWNLSELYSLGYGKKIVKYSIDQINTLRETFLFNTNLESEEQASEIRRYLQIVKDDEKILTLRERIRHATEEELENGTKNTSDLISEINKEDLARKQKSLHEIELIKSLYELKTIKNN